MIRAGAVATACTAIGVALASTFVGSLQIPTGAQIVLFSLGAGLLVVRGGMEIFSRLLRRQAARPDRRAPPELLPVEHTQLLHRLLDGAIGRIERDQQYRWDEETVVGRAHEMIFSAHFPGLAQRIDSWNNHLYYRDAPRSQLGAHAALEAGRRGLLDREYIADRVVGLLRDCTLRYVDKFATAPVIWTWATDLPNVASLFADGQRIAMFPLDVDRGEVVDRFDALLADMTEWDDVREIQAAERRELFYTDKQPLLNDLRCQRKVERFYEAVGCDICRANRGEPTSTTFVAVAA